MAILRTFSSENLVTADLASVFPGSLNNSPAIESSVRGQGIYCSSLNVAIKFDFPAKASFWAHFNYKADGLSTFLVCFNSLAMKHFSIWVNSGGYCEIWRVTSQDIPWYYNNLATSYATLIATGTTQISTGTWYDIQLEVTIADTGGVVKTWINGVADLNETSLDTKYRAAASADSISFTGINGVHVDNIVIGDTSGSHTSPVGQANVDCHFPVSPNGTDREWTRSTGSDDYPLVDDTAIVAGITDYLTSTAVGDQTSFKVEALEMTGGTPHAVQISAYLTKVDAGPGIVKPYVLRGGTRYYGAEWAPSYNTWTLFRYVWDQDPAAGPGAWTETNFNNSEFGLERTA